MSKEKTRTKPILNVPKFKTTQEEAEWWDRQDLSDLIEHGEEVQVRFKKPPTHVFSVRLESRDMRAVSDMAEEAGVGFSTMLRMLVKEGLRARAESATPSGKTVKSKTGRS